MAEEKSQAKWASEAFEFLRLFQRTRSSLVGLLLLVIGWALLLVLVAKLSSGTGPPTITWPTTSGSPAFELALPSAFTLGAAVIVVLWVLANRLYLFLWLPARHLVRDAAIVVTYPLAIALGLLLLPLILARYPIERRKIRQWKAQHPQELEKVRQDLEEREKRPPSTDEVDKWIVAAYTKFSHDSPLEVLAAPLRRQLRSMASAGYIGLSPFYSYSLEEDQRAAKAPLQIFAAAIGRLRYRFPRMTAARHVHFIVLPALPRIESDDKARTIRRWLRLDALLWGSYISVAPPRVWLNIQQRRVEPEFSEKERWLEDRRFANASRPLSGGAVDQPSIVLEQDDPLDAYIVIVLTLLEATRARRERRFRLHSKYLDELGFDTAEQKRLLDELIRDALFDVVPPLVPFARHQTAKQALVAKASVWVARTIEDWDWPSLEDKPSAKLLEVVAAHCANLEPVRAEHWYRLGAARCLIEDEEGALSAFRDATKLERPAAYADPISALVSASFHFDRLNRAGRMGECSRALTAAATARAMKVGDDYVREQLVQEFQKTDFHTLNQLHDAQRPLMPSTRVLYRLLGLTPPTPKP